MYSALRTPLLLLLPLFVTISASAQEAPEIEVTNVRFDRVAGDWIVASVDIRPGDNTLPTARDKDFLDDVRLSIYLSFKLDGANGEEEFAFYRSTVRMVSIESPNTYSLKFFLPGVVRDRDDLDVTPFAWIIEMEVGGQKVPLRDDQFEQREIKSKQAYDSFLSKANSDGAENDGILLPIYLAPSYIVNEARVNFREVPAFYRFEPEN